ncbi:MAG: transglutaminase family protein [Rhodobacterales bacterium]|nr:transglutaminase family protein [Rhodobacterales bacterium]
MLYDIRLRITYDYDRPAAEGRQLLRLLPVDLPDLQRVQSSALKVDPTPAERAEFRDFFGNRVVQVALTGGHAMTRFEAVARVERTAGRPVPATAPALYALVAEIAAMRGLDAMQPHHFRNPSPRIGAVTEITAYTAKAAKPARDVIRAVESVGLALHRDMTFDPKATTVETAPVEAFVQRKGVCQDYAQIMIAGLRGVGIPAGYVSGYLRTVPPPGKPRLEGADAMHAWVMAWCGQAAGWVEFDPTNACFVTDQHITIARGRDYGDVSPVAGILRTSGHQRSSQAVDVIALQEKPASAAP